MNKDIEILSDFEEKEYDLSSIGIPNLFLVFEYTSIYFYSIDSDFFLGINSNFIDYLLTSIVITLKDDEYSFTFSEEQSELIKNILRDVVDGNYRARLTETF